MKKRHFLALALGVLMSIMVNSAYGGQISLKEFYTQVSNFAISHGKSQLVQGVTMEMAYNSLVNAAKNEQVLVQKTHQAFQKLTAYAKDTEIAAKMDQLSRDIELAKIQYMIAMIAYAYYFSIRQSVTTTISIPLEIAAKFSAQDTQAVNTLLSSYRFEILKDGNRCSFDTDCGLGYVCVKSLGSNYGACKRRW